MHLFANRRLSQNSSVNVCEHLTLFENLYAGIFESCHFFGFLTSPEPRHLLPEHLE